MADKVDELIQKLKLLEDHHDTESAHSQADSILLDLLEIAFPDRYKEIEDAYGEVPKWYA